MKKKKIAILGSTGSIGINTLDVISSFALLKYNVKFEVTALTTNSNINLLDEQIKRFKPHMVGIMNDKLAHKLKEKYNGNGPLIYAGMSGLIKLIRTVDADLIVVALVGSSGLIPVLESIKCKKNIALANKESLVSAGSIIMEEAKKNNVKIIPIDSEHSAIFQCLNGENISKVRRIILTASGGPFYNSRKKDMQNITIRQALAHPKWDMGRKVTIDSAMLLNKGFEIIEAHYLFGIPVNNIEVVIHPQCVVHSMVEFVDGSFLAQLGITDMRIPIQYALSYPNRLNNNLPRLNLTKIQELSFFKPDLNKFPCLSYAIESLKVGGSLPAVLCSSSEVAVRSFLSKKIKFLDIPKIIKKVMNVHKVIKNPDFSKITNVLKWASKYTEKEIKKIE